MSKAKKIFKLLIDIVEYFLIITLIIYLILFFYSKYVKKDNLFSIGNYYIFQIASGSMEDGIHIGDYIIVEKTDEFKPGDIVTFKEGNSFITHRIVSTDGDSVITKGDANKTKDMPIDKKSIIGKYVMKSAIIGLLFKYKFMIIAIIISIMILNSCFNNKKENVKETED